MSYTSSVTHGYAGIFDDASALVKKGVEGAAKVKQEAESAVAKATDVKAQVTSQVDTYSQAFQQLPKDPSAVVYTPMTSPPPAKPKIQPVPPSQLTEKQLAELRSLDFSFGKKTPAKTSTKGTKVTSGAQAAPRAAKADAAASQSSTVAQASTKVADAPAEKRGGFLSNKVVLIGLGTAAVAAAFFIFRPKKAKANRRSRSRRSR
jgi:type IV secretory pathway VirB10-like protein